MRLFLVLLLLSINLYSDAVEKTWNLVAKNDASFNNIDDLPLAKTYPVDKPVEKKNIVEKKAPQIDIEKSIEELKKSIRTVKKKEQVEKTVQTPTPVKEKNDFGFYIKFLQDNPRLAFALLGSIATLIFLFWYLSSTDKKKEDFGYDPENEKFLKIFSDFLNLKGKVHEQYIIRKQNILFNNDFSQYQKAKALLELEKEYNDLEFFQISKLLSTDFSQLVKAGEVLTSKPELKNIVSEYIEKSIENRDYTKEQKRILRENIKNYYHTPNHIWEYEKSLETRDKKEQASYLLQ